MRPILRAIVELDSIRIPIWDLTLVGLSAKMDVDLVYTCVEFHNTFISLQNSTKQLDKWVQYSPGVVCFKYTFLCTFDAVPFCCAASQ